MIARRGEYKTESEASRSAEDCIDTTIACAKTPMTIKHQVSEMLLEKGALKEVIEAIDEHVVQLLEKYSDDQVPFPLLILHMNIRQILSSA